MSSSPKLFVAKDENDHNIYIQEYCNDWLINKFNREDYILYAVLKENFYVYKYNFKEIDNEYLFFNLGLNYFKETDLDIFSGKKEKEVFLINYLEYLKIIEIQSWEDLITKDFNINHIAYQDYLNNKYLIKSILEKLGRNYIYDNFYKKEQEEGNLQFKDVLNILEELTEKLKIFLKK